jgi:hypothetical protein
MPLALPATIASFLLIAGNDPAARQLRMDDLIFDRWAGRKP